MRIPKYAFVVVLGCFILIFLPDNFFFFLEERKISSEKVMCPSIFSFMGF